MKKSKKVSRGIRSGIYKNRGLFYAGVFKGNNFYIYKKGYKKEAWADKARWRLVLICSSSTSFYKNLK